MPRYFFDIEDGDGVFVDDVGLQFKDMDTAICEARKAIADMVRDALREAHGSQISILVRDGADRPVLITVTMTTDTISSNRPRIDARIAEDEKPLLASLTGQSGCRSRC